MTLNNLPWRLLKGALLLSIGSGLMACSDSEPGGAQASLSPEQQRIAEGKRVARMCVGCHGPEGISRVASYPSIAGLPQDYLEEQLHAFRSGERDNPMMSSVARNLSDEAIDSLSHYFASLPGAGDE
ncbi:cytochrome c [Marinimicrobium sp. C6131]|uniref:c-type cytochrome n=1 Tax=Marinimicrobium sp. C6131 TaxID=3022676 RepID=UPI00223DF181|nr:cytochrome c [Marinimicrobium sp. C6131]UZJ45833.1 cytochrome c [Marinimicrobium sp. C6131]